MKTNHLTIEQRGFYRDFLDWCWIEGGSIGLDMFKKKLGIHTNKFRVLWGVIAEYTVEYNGKYSHPKLLDIFHKVEEKSVKNSESAKMRWKKEKSSDANASVSHSERNANHNHNQIHNQSIIYIVDFLNSITGQKYKSNAKKTASLIVSKLNAGFTVEDFKKAIQNKYTEWKGTKYEQYLRPVTLFGEKFEGYVNQKPVQSEGDRISKIFNLQPE